MDKVFTFNVGSAALDQLLEFTALSLTVDNPTNQWLRLDSLGVSIPQYTLGATYQIPGTTRARATWAAPSGVSQPPVQTGQAATITFNSLALPSSAGVGMLGGRAAYYDRNPKGLTFAGNGVLGEGAAATVLWGPYTVPAGRRAYIEAAKAITTIIQRYNSNVSAAGVGLISTQILVFVAASGIPSEIVNAKIVYGKEPQTDARDLLGISMELQAGDIVSQANVDGRTLAGATGISYHEADIKITEFDA